MIIVHKTWCWFFWLFDCAKQASSNKRDADLRMMADKYVALANLLYKNMTYSYIPHQVYEEDLTGD
jgi:hypothetical protein